MKKDLLLEVLSHHGQVVKEDEVESVRFQTIDGPVTILSNHISYFGAVQIGVVDYVLNGKVNKLVIGSHGIIEVFKNHVTIIVHTAERPEDIDIERAKRDRDEAMYLIDHGKPKTTGGFDSHLALKLAKARISLGEESEN